MGTDSNTGEDNNPDKYGASKTSSRHLKKLTCILLGEELSEKELEIRVFGEEIANARELTQELIDKMVYRPLGKGEEGFRWLNENYIWGFNPNYRNKESGKLLNRIRNRFWLDEDTSIEKIDSRAWYGKYEILEKYLNKEGLREKAFEIMLIRLVFQVFWNDPEGCKDVREEVENHIRKNRKSLSDKIVSTAREIIHHNVNATLKFHRLKNEIYVEDLKKIDKDSTEN